MFLSHSNKREYYLLILEWRYNLLKFEQMPSKLLKNSYSYFQHFHSRVKSGKSEDWSKQDFLLRIISSKINLMEDIM